MATYTGQTDYISQIQPTEPNLAFDAQILQTKQSKYDANHKKVSELYGSLLNSSMTRTDNIQARDEFFKIINDDVRRMGSLDFSLDQNVQAAAGVFQSIYTNNNIVKDMVWTKNYNSELDRAESFKNCVDEEKCGGTYWEEGEKYMQYKRAEFKNASAGDALNMGDVKYIPYKNVMKESMRLAKDAGLNVELDKISGDYKITTKNGELIRTPLTTLFNQTMGKDPSFAEMFKAQAYVSRNDWAANKINLGEYSDLNEANLGYLQSIDKQNISKLEDTLESLNLDSESLDQQVYDMKSQYEKGEFVEGSDKYNNLVSLIELQGNAKSAKAYTEQVYKLSKMTNNQMAIQNMADHSDDQNAYSLFNDEISKAVNTLAFKDYKQSMTLDDIAKMKYESSFKKSEMALQHQYDVAEEQQDYENAVSLEDHKKSIGHSSYSGEDKSKSSVSANEKYISTKNLAEASKNNLNEQYRIELKKLGQAEVPTEATIQAWKDDPTNSENAANLRDYAKAQQTVNKKHNQLLRDANVAAIKNGVTPIYRDVITAKDIDTFDDDLDYDYKGTWNKNTYDNLKKEDAFSKITEEQYIKALGKADSTKPLVDELRKELKIILK